jgi:hypothetical protein
VLKTEIAKLILKIFQHAFGSENKIYLKKNFIYKIQYIVIGIKKMILKNKNRQHMN